MLKGGGILYPPAGLKRIHCRVVVPFAKGAEDTSFMDDHQILARAMTWMRLRGWREKVAKSSSGQSLYEHTLIELDAFLQLAPILRDPKRYGLTEIENWIVIVSLIVHDAGKESAQWQEYVTSRGAAQWISHILPELSEKLVPKICAALGIEGIGTEVHQVIAECAGIHHDRPGRSDAAILKAMLTDAPSRFVTLANLVKALDHLCSAESPADASLVVQNDESLRRHVKVTTHELIYRGVSTALLHRASQHAFEQAGWMALLYFPAGTVYIADLGNPAADPSPFDIRSALTAELESALKRDLTSMMVGSPTGNMLPKPELLSFAEAQEYLTTAGSKINPRSFAKKKLPDRRKVVTEYLKLRGELDGPPSDEEIARQSGRISVAQPEMLVFKFFKAMLDPDKVPAVGEDGAELARQKYEALLGPGTWAQLQSTSTLMAAKDMTRTVDPYWSLSGNSVGHEAAKVEQIDDQTRLKILVKLLAGIATEVFETINRPSPRDALAGAMAGAFMGDLIRPAQGQDIKVLARDQLANYRQSKPNAGKDLASALYICPVCSKPFSSGAGVKASADFIDNPQTHTNRGVSHGGFAYVMICSTCYHERVLRQLLMGEAFAELITLSPRLNLGPANGSRLVQKVREWADAANSIGDLEFGFSMSFTDQTARQMRAHDPFQLDPEELIGLFRFRFTSDTQKKRKKDALELLKQSFESDLDSLNAACASSFYDWDDAIKALMADTIDQQECKAIRRQAFRTGGAIQLIPQTPNLILIPLRYEIASGTDESESNKAIRRLYVSLILSVVFDAAVSIRRNADISDASRSAGAAYVPPVAAVRSLIGSEWVSVTRARYWLNAIGAAGALARDAALPARSGLYQALSIEPAEKLVRRIEENGRPASPLHLNLISQLPGFHAE